MYKLQINILNEESVIRLKDMAHIPYDLGNIDYQAYLAWLEEGNEVLPPDEPNAE
jgi:hypothetical protein